MPQVSENAKNITEKFIDDTNLGINEYDSIAKNVSKLLDKVGDLITKTIIEDAVSSYNDGKIQNPAAALNALIKKQLKHTAKKATEDESKDSTYIRQKECPQCGRLGYSLEDCTFCNPRPTDWPQPNDTRKLY